MTTTTPTAGPAAGGRASRDATALPDGPVIVLDIGGMTCASCSARIEKKLNRLPGVEASVNLATDTARVRLPAGTDGAARDTVLAEVVSTVERLGYSAAEPPPEPAELDDALPERVRALGRRALAAAVLTVPVLVVSMVPAAQFTGWEWVALVLAAPVVTWGGWPFHRAAASGLRHGSVGMDTLVSMGVTAATLWSVYAIVAGGHVYLEVACVITTFILAGRWAELRARHSAAGALRALIRLGSRDAVVLREGPDGTRREVTVPARRLSVGDEMVVLPGGRIPADGVVVGGTAAVDTSLVTGESVPVDVEPGADVVGGTTVGGGRLVVRATRVGADTTLARMTRLVAEAQSGKAAVQRLADRVSAVFVPIVIVIAAVTALVWLVVGWGEPGAAEAALTASVAVLVIACPCALGLATPTALLVGTGRGARLGVLIRSPEVLETTRRLDTVVLDKTGTLTEGRPALAAVTAAEGEDPAELLRLAGLAETASEHPVAAAIVTGARERGIAVPADAAHDVVAVPGRGITATVEGRRVAVGRPAWVADEVGDPPATLAAAAADEESRGRTVMAVAWDGRARGILAVADTVRPTSAAAVAALRDLGLRPVLVTGDNPTTAAAVAAQVGIAPADVIAGVLPEGKSAEVARLRAEGRTVAVVGDGVNDAPALASADLGMAMGSGAEVAVEAADITLVRPDPALAATAVRLSRATLRTIKQNLFWAFAYNVAAIPLAALGLLNPMIAGFAMAASSVLVVTNSLRLTRLRA